MHQRCASFVVCLVFLLTAVGAQAATNWKEGENYFLIKPALATSVAPGKVEVTEVFSYGCPACFKFYPIADKLKAGLPPNAQMTYVHASFIPSEAWPMFQLAYYTAVSLGIAEKAHNQMFEAVWSTGELAILEPKTQRLKTVMPTIEDAAKFYSRVAGVKPEAFVAASKSFSVNLATTKADAFIKAGRVPGTPHMIVNGKYRYDVTSAGGVPQLIELTNWLVAQESKK